MSKQAYIFIGPPGSGKGSLSRLCMLHMGWQQFSTGNHCRKHITEQTPIGKEIDFIIKSGKLISDDLVLAMVDDWLTSSVATDTSLILDGFPRNGVQAESLLQMIKSKYASLKLRIVKFIVSDQVAIDRLCNRLTCNNSDCQSVYSGHELSSLAPKRAFRCDYCSADLIKRCDDGSHDIVKARLQTYRTFEQEILDRLAGHEYIEVNVERPLDEIFETFKISINDAA